MQSHSKISLLFAYCSLSASNTLITEYLDRTFLRNCEEHLPDYKTQHHTSHIPSHYAVTLTPQHNNATSTTSHPHLTLRLQWRGYTFAPHTLHCMEFVRTTVGLNTAAPRA
jgi:hypothetical protein